MINEESEPCPRLCGICENFKVLDSQSGGPYEWFGVCWLEIERDLGSECWTGTTIDWIYQEGRHGNDDCEKPDEWFEKDDWYED